MYVCFANVPYSRNNFTSAHTQTHETCTSTSTGNCTHAEVLQCTHLDFQWCCTVTCSFTLQNITDYLLVWFVCLATHEGTTP